MTKLRGFGYKKRRIKYKKLKSVGLNYNRETSKILKERGLDLFSIKGAIKTKEVGE